MTQIDANMYVEGYKLCLISITLHQPIAIRFMACVGAGAIQSFLLNGPSTNDQTGCPIAWDSCWSWGLTMAQVGATRPCVCMHLQRQAHRHVSLCVVSKPHHHATLHTDAHQTNPTTTTHPSTTTCSLP